MKKGKGILQELGYRAGLLNDGMPEAGSPTEEITPVTIEETTATIANGSDNILPDEYVETETLLNDLEGTAEFVEDELNTVAEEQVMAAEGLQSDFSKVTSAHMIASIARINSKFGAGAIATSGLQSDKFGGHKALYTHGLQAKENFLKSQLESFKQIIDSIIQKIKMYATKIATALNQDGKESEKLIGIIDSLLSQKAVLKEGAEIDEKLYKHLADKFGAFLAMGGKFEDYETIVAGDLLSINPVPKAISATELEIESASSIRTLIAGSSLFSTMGVGKDDFWPVFIAGKTIRVIAADAAESGAADSVKINGKAYKNISYETIATNDKDAMLKAKTITAIPSLDTLRGMAETAKASAKGLSTFASNAWSRVDGYKKIISEAGKENGPGLSPIISNKLPMIATRVSNDAVTMYTATQKTLNGTVATFSGMYAAPKKD